MNAHRRATQLLVTAILLLISTAAIGQTYDVAWTFGAVGTAAYRLDAVAPGGIDFGTLDSQNPTLPLELGKRYQVEVTNYTVHPLEIIAKSANSSLDVVLLSMAVQGSFESDAKVKWEDDGQGTVRFTMTTALYQAMMVSGHTPGYRCRPHFMEMRGDFSIGGLPIDDKILPSGTRVDVQVVASGLAAPVALVPEPGQPARLYVVDQAGLVRIISQGQLQAASFLDVRTRLVQPLGILGSHDGNDYDERGLLGMAFHPDYADAAKPGYHKIYTYTSEPIQGPADFTVAMPAGQMDHQSVITEWQLARTGNVINAGSARVVMRIDQPQFNHNGGMLAFGPEGYLYVGLGDGGNANDAGPGHGTNGNGQNVNVVHGKILRIDPVLPALTPGSRDPNSANGAYRIPWDNPFVGIDGVDEIFAYGFRNPYRFSFDKLTGALIVGDVGQGYVEEVDVVRKGGNYGWRIKEGSFLFDPTGLLIGLPFADSGLIDPVAQYDHEDGLSIIGGYMYYGAAIPDLRAMYVFADFSRGFLKPDGRLLVANLYTGLIQELLIGADGRSLGLFVKGMGQDPSGEVYVLASTALGPYGTTGVVLKIVPMP